jgi:sulfate transport system permease protein
VKRRSISGTVLPGFGISLGISILYLSLIVLLPLSTIFLRAANISLSEIWSVLSAPRVCAALKLSFLCALAAAAFNLLAGFLVAWVLVRYKFPGKKLVDGLIDLPFALPTAIAGIVLTTLYSPNGWIGAWLQHLGIKAAFAPLGIMIALSFVSFPFVVRSLQPVLADLEPEFEEAAYCMGAKHYQTFYQIILPELWPAMLSGFSLALARALGEYGSVVFISGNLPFKTELMPLLIMSKLEQFDYAGATVLGLAMLLLSFAFMLLINCLSTRMATQTYE